MLESVKLTSFRSAEVRLGPLTALVGPNASGKFGDTGVHVRGIRTTGEGCIDAFVEPMAARVAWEP